MLVRILPGGQLLCVHQNSHALMAADFCRHWGNHDFAKPAPYEIVMNAIAQHDNGWYEWEAAAKLDGNNAPLAFIPGPSYAEKLPIWQLGIDRAAAQHPYMGLMVSRHASLLYRGDLQRMEDGERAATEAFLSKQEAWTEAVRRLLADDEELRYAASEAVLMAHTRLLKFGDSSSLQVAMPWSQERRLAHCPVDFVGTYTAIMMRWDGQEISFDPWPFDVDHFTVSLHGRLLDQSTFPSNAAYQRALAEAPFHTLVWHVAPAAAGA